MDKVQLEQMISQLPLYAYFYTDPQKMEFSDRVRYICGAECPMYGKTWACPPAVGHVADCAAKCRSYDNCLAIGTITEVTDIGNMHETLQTRREHEEITNTVRSFMQQLGAEPYVLSTEACAACERCAYLDGQPCRYPDRMHPCVESHGINLIPTLEENGLDFQIGGNVVTWYSLFFFNE